MFHGGSCGLDLCKDELFSTLKWDYDYDDDNITIITNDGLKNDICEDLRLLVKYHESFVVINSFHSLNSFSGTVSDRF
jgi:hypothetical protein